MSEPNASAPTGDLARDVRVRPAARADRDAIIALVHDAFGRDEEAALVRTIWAAPQYLPDLELVAVAGVVVVGHVLFSIGYVASTEVLALAPFSVAPAWLRR